MRRVTVALIVSILIIFTFSSVGWAAEAEQPYISVSGEGMVEVAPNRADINLAVVTESVDVKTAQEQNARMAKKLIDSLLKAGIREQNIVTSGYNIQPRYDYSTERQQLTGYQVVNEIKVTVEEVAVVGGIIDMAVKNGANEIRNIRFYSVGNLEQKIAALRQAVENARQKAEVIAAALGKEIVGVKSAGGNWYDQTPPPVLFEKMVAADEAESTPVNPGQVTIRASAEIVYLISQ